MRGAPKQGRRYLDGRQRPNPQHLHREIGEVDSEADELVPHEPVPALAFR